MAAKTPCYKQSHSRCLSWKCIYSNYGPKIGCHGNTLLSLVYGSVTVTFWRPCHAIFSAIVTVLSLTRPPNSTCMTDVVYVTGHASLVACLALSAARGDRPVNRGGHQVTTSAACQAVSGEFNAGRCRGQINVLTGAVLKKARARIYLCLCAVLSFTGNAGSSLIRSVWFSIIWTCSKSLLTTSVWSAGRRSKGDNRIR